MGVLGKWTLSSAAPFAAMHNSVVLRPGLDPFVVDPFQQVSSDDGPWRLTATSKRARPDVGVVISIPNYGYLVIKPTKRVAGRPLYAYRTRTTRV